MAIRIGLIGLGRQGRQHLETLAGFPDAQVAALCDTDRSKIEPLAQKLGASMHISFRTLIESERLDAMIISVPPFARGEMEIMAARSGIHLLMESPVSVGVEKAREVQKEIEKSGIVASVCYPWRYLSGVTHSRVMLKDRKIAIVRGWRFTTETPTGWRCRRESSGGRFVQEGSHLVDLARFFAGEVSATSRLDVEGMITANVPGYDVQDAVAASCRFVGGAVGQFTVSGLTARDQDELTILCGDLELRVTADAVEVYEPGRMTRVEHEEKGLQPVQQAFINAVTTGDAKGVLSTYGDAVKTLEACAGS